MSWLVFGPEPIGQTLFGGLQASAFRSKFGLSGQVYAHEQNSCTIVRILDEHTKPVPGDGVGGTRSELSEQYSAWPPDRETMRCPFEYFSRIRREAPVYRYPTPASDGSHTYLVTGFPECAEVLTRADVFANDIFSAGPSRDIDPSPRPDVPTFYEARNVFFADGEDHKVKRGWGLMLFERDRLEGFRPIVLEEVDRMIDGFIADGRCDFRVQFSDLMPMQVVRRIMGLPESADPMIKRLSAALASIDGNPEATHAMEVEASEASLALYDLCAEQCERRHEQPQDDFVSELVQAQVARDGALDPNALGKHLAITIFGADHAMGGHLADLMARIARHPDVQRRLREDRTLVRQLMLEGLRTENPVPWLFRRCVQDTMVGEVEIPAGSTVIAATLAGNHDPQEFPAPEDFDLSRSNLERNQLSLGRGKHRCVGAPMARIQVEVTVNRMLDRLEDIRLDEERSDLTPVMSFGFRVPAAVHLTFTRPAHLNTTETR